MELILALAHVLHELLRFRYMFAGLLAGSLAGLGHNYVFEVSDRNAVNETLFWTIVTGAVIGLAFDIRRGLRR